MSTTDMHHRRSARLVTVPILLLLCYPVARAATPEGQSDFDDSAALVLVENLLADHAAEQLLERMVAAQHRLEYDGTLVYLHGRQLSALHIARRIKDGVASESLLALSGPVRALARNERGVFCMLPDAHPFSTPRKAQGAVPLAAQGPLDFTRIRQHYRVRLVGDSRVAGRETDVVEILSTDKYRYGYRYFLDRATGLALKSELIGNGATPVEQVMFTNVEVHETPGTNRPPPAQSARPGPGVNTALGPGAESAPGREPGIAPETARDRASERRPSTAPTDASRPDDRAGHPAGDAGHWTLSKMPPGFAPVSMPRADKRAMLVEHLVVSDGLATVSVYVESGGKGALIGHTEMGAINAVGEAIEGYHATVIGEVPEPTVALLLEGLVPPSARNSD